MHKFGKISRRGLDELQVLGMSHLLLRPWATGLPKRSWSIHPGVNFTSKRSASCYQSTATQSTAATKKQRPWYNNVTGHHKLTRNHQVVSTPSLFSTGKSFPSLSTMPSPDTERYRLPTDVKPTHYDITIHTDLEQLTFNGFVKIRCVLHNPFVPVYLTQSLGFISLDIVRETSTISLNTADLKLGKAYVCSVQQEVNG
jgi:hypothetical protein